MPPTSTNAGPLEQVANHLPIDADAIRARVDAVLQDELYWFPVRHHSPTVAKHLEQVILQRKPKLVFIEGPLDASDLVRFIVDRKTRPPIAIYSSYRDDDNVLCLAGIASPARDIPPRFSSWYPLVEYSPEYVAMKAAAKIGAEVAFMDLPHYALIAPAPQRNVSAEGDAPDENTVAEKTFELDTDSLEMIEHDSELLLAGSNFYQTLAQVAGYKSWAEGWDSLFELRHDADPEEFRHELATFCAAARATTSPARIASDGTLERERCMWQTITQRLSKDKLSPNQALVVSGGFHLFLDRSDNTPPPEAPPGTVTTTVVPYSYFRVSELAGYAAGNRAPQFYGLSWDTIRGKAGDLTTDYVVDLLKKARRRGEHVSSADAISVTQHARMLAALRGRPLPILDDLHDAIITCCCKGDPHEAGIHLLRAMDDADIGTKIGRVTPEMGRLPIVHDFYHRIEEFKFEEALQKEKRVRVNLDKRDERDARRSAFLHRLAFLEIPLCSVVEGATEDFATGLIFREKWALRWTPDVEPKLVEKNLYGDTLESAAIARLREIIAEDELHAGRTCARLVHAIDMDLPDLIREVEQACGAAIDGDTRFPSLSAALGHLTVIDRYAIYHELKRDRLSELIVRCFNRACFAIMDIIAVPEDQQAHVIRCLLGLAEVVLRGKTPGIDRELFAEHVASAARETEVPFLRGAFLGLLAEMRDVTADDLAGEISALAKSSQDQMIRAGELLHGIMTTSRTSILLGANSLVAAIDELLRAAEWEPFLIMLPRIRAAFEELHERQRESIATTVAETYGLQEAVSLTALQVSADAAVRFAEIDCRVADIMRDWEF